MAWIKIIHKQKANESWSIFLSLYLIHHPSGSSSLFYVKGAKAM